MFVRTNLLTIQHARFEYELCVLGPNMATLNVGIWGLVTGLEWIEERLNNMVAINVGWKLKNILVQLIDKLPTVTLHVIDVGRQHLNQRLHSAGAMNTQGYGRRLCENRVDYDSQLIWSTNLDDLLAKIVAELICHSICKSELESVY